MVISIDIAPTLPRATFYILVLNPFSILYSHSFIMHQVRLIEAATEGDISPDDFMAPSMCTLLEPLLEKMG